MKIYNFVYFETDDEFDAGSKYDVLKKWKFIKIMLSANVNPIIIKKENHDAPKQIILRDRMLIFLFDDKEVF